MERDLDNCEGGFLGPVARAVTDLGCGFDVDIDADVDVDAERGSVVEEEGGARECRLFAAPPAPISLLLALPMPVVDGALLFAVLIP